MLVATSAIPYNSPTVPVPEPEPTVCACEYHSIIHPADGIYPLCIYNDHPELFTDDKGGSTHLVMKGPDEAPKEIVHEDGNFCIVKDPDHDPHGYDKPESWVMHSCPTVYWKIYIDEYFMNTHGVCKHCYSEVPSGLIALWKMHNWQYIQDGGMPGEDLAADQACSSA